MQSFKVSPTRRTSLAAAVVAAIVLLGTGPALADGNGSGDFEGYEIPPATVIFTNETTMCAQFVASSTDPLIHELDMFGGDFHGQSGTGTATFTRTDPYYLNPEGTYSDEDCMNPDSLTGTMDIVFEQYDCSGTGTYERRSSSVYTLEFEGTCDDTTTMTVETIPTTVVFTGSQIPCGAADCTGYPSDTGSLMSGAYVQTH